MNMKKLIVMGLALCLLLGGCAVKKDSDDTDGGDETVQLPASAQIAIDAAEQKASYYQKLAAELEDEILTVRTELFASRVEYEARIDDLEDQLADALAEMNQNNGNSNGTEAETKPPQNVGDSSDPKEDPHADFQFLVSDGRATLNAYIGTASSVEIPATYRGCPVVAIADRAFENKTRLQSVVLPSSVETVGWFAFSGCVALKDVTVPASVRSISYGAFLNCNAAMVIRCTSGSYAEQYAKSYGIETKKI